MAKIAAGTVRQKDKLTAIKTSSTAKGMEWFLFDPATGGYYTNGDVEGVADWKELTA